MGQFETRAKGTQELVTTVSDNGTVVSSCTTGGRLVVTASAPQVGVRCVTYLDGAVDFITIYKTNGIDGNKGSGTLIATVSSKVTP